MKKKSLAVLLCASALALVLALVGCSGGESGPGEKTETDGAAGYELITDGKLTVAASLDFPPFENLENGQPVGFSIDLMGLLAEEMGLEVEYLNSVKFDTIVPMVAAGGKADVGASSLTITAEREKEIDFTESYCDSNQGIVVMKDSGITEVAQLEGKKVGAQSGSTGHDWASENIAGATVVAYDEVTAIFAALQAGQIDAIANDLPVEQFLVKDAYPDAEIIAEIPTGEQYGIVVSKENPELTKALNEALAAIKANGKYDEAYAKWFGATS